MAESTEAVPLETNSVHILVETTLVKGNQLRRPTSQLVPSLVQVLSGLFLAMHFLPEMVRLVAHPLLTVFCNSAFSPE